ncbi:MAG TPA: TM2 domain-containing protein [Chitinophagaceae bacterium]
MRKLLFTLLFAAMVVVAKADPGQYTINDAQVEATFAKGVDISSQLISSQDKSTLFNSMGLNTANASMASAGSGGKEFAVALLLNFFLGGLGIHRLYLGTKTITWVGYILTCGGIFGIVPLVDFIVLIIHNEDISPYVNNPKFFMWANG